MRAHSTVGLRANNHKPKIRVCESWSVDYDLNSLRYRDSKIYYDIKAQVLSDINFSSLEKLLAGPVVDALEVSVYRLYICKSSELKRCHAWEQENYYLAVN